MLSLLLLLLLPFLLMTALNVPTLTPFFCPHLLLLSPHHIFLHPALSLLLVSPPPSPSVSHGVLAKLVAELLDEQSQLPCSLGLLLQELVTEAGNILLDLLQLTCKAATHGHKRSQHTNVSV